MRQAKELEYRRKLEEEQLRKQRALVINCINANIHRTAYFQEAQQEKRKVQSVSKDIKSKKFTYDYNGKVIVTQNLMPEKLPPATYTVK